MRLPDVYYTKQVLDGYYEPPGVQAPIQYYIGEDIDFDVYLNYCGKPVLVEDWDITAIVKSNKYNKCVKWTGVLNNGIYHNIPQAYYKIVIPSGETKTWEAGTYWLEIVIREKLGRGTGPKDMDVFLMRQPFGLDYSIASDTPEFVTKQQPERTAPNIVDISKQ